MEYSNMTDNEICNLIMDGNEEAALYLIYDRYAEDIRYKAYTIFKTFDYLDDLNQILYIHLKGSDHKWQTLRTFKNECRFRTWFIGSVVNNLFLSKRRLMIGTERFHNLLIETDPEKPLPEPKQELRKDERLIAVMEAISKLKNDEYRFILIKDLEGYNHTEIAAMIELKRKKENKVKYYAGKPIVPNAAYVDQAKAKALAEVKLIVETDKNEYYANK